MLRKWTALAASMAAFAILATGLTMADEDSPLHKLMEKVQSTSVAVTKATRNKVNFAKQQKDVVKNAKELAKFAKEARPFEEPSKKQKQPYEKWTKIMDEFEKTSSELAAVAEKADPKNADDYAKVKKAYTAVKKACSDCHNVFRVEEDEKF